jgi:hypothetical protein
MIYIYKFSMGDVAPALPAQRLRIPSAAPMGSIQVSTRTARIIRNPQDGAHMPSGREAKRIVANSRLPRYANHGPELAVQGAEIK